MYQNLLSLSITLLIFSITGCEKPPPPNVHQSKENERDFETPLVKEKVENDTSLPAPAPAPQISQVDNPVLKAPGKKPVKSEPIIPPFSEELLVAVSNWKNIPKSVFPMESVQLKEDVALEVRTQSGQVMATSVAENGSKVTVLGIENGMLVVANPNQLRLRGRVELDKSDFKQMVAYLFDSKKRQREKTQSEAEIPTKIDDLQDESKIIESATQEKEDFIPDPLDFGHGRFCICQDCRKKRLAVSGNLKTGFGIEP